MAAMGMLRTNHSAMITTCTITTKNRDSSWFTCKEKKMINLNNFMIKNV
jgi:hypothetical protein